MYFNQMVYVKMIINSLRFFQKRCDEEKVYYG